MQTKTRRPRMARPAPAVDQDTVRRELAWAAGAKEFQHRDPLYHVTESFGQIFDRVGREHAAALAPERDTAALGEEQQGPERVPMREEPSKTLPNTAIPLRSFAETAFQRGRLSAAVLEGTGKMMLVSCLRRSVGQVGPEKLKQRTLFDVGSQRRNLPGRGADQMVFNRGVAQSAVGLVVDTIRDARYVIDAMEEMAQGTGELGAGDGGETLRTMYPFLDDSRERGLLEQYRTQLTHCTQPEQVPILQNAMVHTRALLDKKAQMKVEFINKLRFISDRAAEAQKELEAPGVVEEVAAALLQPQWEEEGELPPEEGAGDGGRDGKKQPEDGGTSPGDWEEAGAVPGADDGGGADGAGAPGAAGRGDVPTDSRRTAAGHEPADGQQRSAGPDGPAEPGA